MHLNRFTDNALRCLTFLALRPDESSTASEIARRMRMSEDHLAKVIQRLTQLGYVETTRGRHGGVQLAKPPERISVGRVVRETEETFALVECFTPDTNQCPIAPACTLAGVLDEALQAFLTVLDERTLADLAQRPARLRRLLELSA